MSHNPLDIPGEAFQVEFWNPNPSSRRNGDGARYFLRLETSKETHDAFMEARESNLRMVGYLSVLPDTDEEKAAAGVQKAIDQNAKERAKAERATDREKAKAEKAEAKRLDEEARPWRHFWAQLLYKDNFHFSPEVAAVIGRVVKAHEDLPVLPEPERTHEALKRYFRAEHLGHVSPDDVAATFPSAAKMVWAALDKVERRRNKELSEKETASDGLNQTDGGCGVVEGEREPLPLDA